MGVMDKFLNAMRLNSDDDDEYYDDDDFYDEEEEEDYDDTPKKNLFRRHKDKNISDYDDDDDFGAADSASGSRYSQSSSKITPMRSSRRSTPAPSGRASMAVCVIKPISVEDAREIIETLLSGRTIVLNLEGLDLEIAQRIIDYTSGAVYAIGGNLQKISNYIFIVTPQSVDITGDIQSIMGSFGADSGLQTDI